jgi:hypothetical protein
LIYILKNIDIRILQTKKEVQKMEEKKSSIIVGTQAAIPDYDLLTLPLEDIEGIVKNQMAHDLAKTILNSEVVEIKENPDFNGYRPCKVFKTEFVIMTIEEYVRLRKIEEVFLQL